MHAYSNTHTHIYIYSKTGLFEYIKMYFFGTRQVKTFA